GHRSTLGPLDCFLLGCNIQDVVTGKQFLRFTVRAISDHRGVTGEVDHDAFLCIVQSFSSQQHSSADQFVVELPHLFEDFVEVDVLELGERFVGCPHDQHVLGHCTQSPVLWEGRPSTFSSMGRTVRGEIDNHSKEFSRAFQRPRAYPEGTVGKRCVFPPELVRGIMASSRSSDHFFPERGAAARMVNSYAALLKSVRSAGLLKRRRGFYITVFVILMLAWAGTWSGFLLLRDTWFQLLIAAGMGVVLTQFAFLAPEAAHRQVFKSKSIKEWSPRLIGTGLVGISYAMWAQKHTRHHNFPNVIDKDPDIHTGAIAFHPEAAASRRGVMVRVTRKQGWLLFPLLFFLGASLHVDSLKYLLRQRKADHRWVEIPVILLRLLVVPVLVFSFLPLGMAFAFLG